MPKYSHMLAKLIKEPFDEKGWLFEIKWDGYRAFGIKTKRGCDLLSRSKKSFRNIYPTIIEALQKIPGTFILDGEIVILDRFGRSHFQKLQNYQKTGKGTPYFYVFDLLVINDKDVRKLPLTERKKRVKSLLKGSKTIRYSPHVLERGKALFKKAEKKGLEGIIAKKADSPYLAGRSSKWLKIKTTGRQEVVIGGFTQPKGSRKALGALLIGVYKGGKLHYAGKVGGGFTHERLKEVRKKLQPLIQEKCPFMSVPKVAKATWVRPKLVSEVEFTEWTSDGKLRHPIFKGLRGDKPAKKVVRE